MTALTDGITRQLKHLEMRQRVIAQNVANSETPGFKAQDVEAPDFADLLPGTGTSAHVARPRVQLTASMQALGARPLLSGAIVFDNATSETKPDGNNVTLEDQLLKMGQIQADFAAMTGLYRKQLALLKSAIGKGSA